MTRRLAYALIALAPVAATLFARLAKGAITPEQAQAQFEQAVTDCGKQLEAAAAGDAQRDATTAAQLDKIEASKPEAAQPEVAAPKTVTQFVADIEQAAKDALADAVKPSGQ